MKITFSKAQQALQHVKKQQMANGQQWIPDLLKAKGVGGWCYHLKNDLTSLFEVEIEQLQDLQQEAQQLLPDEAKQTGVTKDEVDGLDIEDGKKKRLKEIIDELDALQNEEKQLKLTKGKIAEKDIEQHLNAMQYEDLDFAIDFSNIKNGEPKRINV